MQLQASLKQNEALQSERASLAAALKKLEAFKRNLLHTLQASDVGHLLLSYSCAGSCMSTVLELCTQK